MKYVQKQYEKRIKVNQNKDNFTTYQRLSQHDHSPILFQKQNALKKIKLDNQHHQIQSLKCTLMSLNQQQQASLDLSKATSKIGQKSINQRQINQLQHKKYNIKLDNLSKNLQQIASKDYFSPANSITNRPKSSTLIYNQPNIRNDQSYFEKSKQITLNDRLNKNQKYLQYSKIMQYGGSKSQTLIKQGSKSRTNSNNNSQNKSSQLDNSYKQMNKINQQWSGKSSFNSNNKKHYNKKDIIAQPSNNIFKNLTKIFQKYQQSHIDIPKLRDRADTISKQNQVIYHQKIHRSMITSILIADSIYTSSLDYTVQRISQNNGEYNAQIINKYRGGVQFMQKIGNKIFEVSRDCYIRSIDGNYHYKFDTCPVKFYQSERVNNISIKFYGNKLNLFDMQKRTMISQILVGREYEMMSKWNKQLYICSNEGILSLDWRRKDNLIEIYKANDNFTKDWISNPFTKQFSYHSKGQIYNLSDKYTKLYNYKLLDGQNYINYDWSRVGLNILTNNMDVFKLIRFKNQNQRQQIDVDFNSRCLSLVVVRDRQIIYGDKNGELIIKKSRK